MKRKTGIKEKSSSLLIYDYETMCGSGDEEIEIPDYYMLPEDRIPDCRDQKWTGQCVAYAATNIMQIMNFIETGVRKVFSTTYFYGKNREECDRESEGMYEEEALEFWTKRGSCLHEDFPDLLEVPEAYDAVRNRPDLDEKAEPYKIASYAKFNQGMKKDRIAALQRAILKYQYPALGIVKASRALHAVSIIGWDVKKEILYVMNSWGDRRGNKGIDPYKYEKLRRAFFVLDAKNANLMPFEDVSEDKWYYKAIQHAYNSGIMKGVSDTLFEPERGVLRSELAQALVNLCKKQDEVIEALEERIRTLEEK